MVVWRVCIAAAATSASARVAVRRSVAIASPVAARSAAICSCSASNEAMVGPVMPIAFIAGQAISCSPSWCSVSWASKLAQARCSASARSRSPSREGSSARRNRSRSRRTAQWITLFMLMGGVDVAMPVTLGAEPGRWEAPGSVPYVEHRKPPYDGVREESVMRSRLARFVLWATRWKAVGEVPSQRRAGRSSAHVQLGLRDDAAHHVARRGDAAGADQEGALPRARGSGCCRGSAACRSTATTRAQWSATSCGRRAAASRSC